MHRLAVVSYSKNTNTALQTQLKRLLGNNVELRGYCLCEPVQKEISGDLVLVASTLAFPAASRHIRPGCPVMIARRCINHHEIGRLLDIPKGTKVLLVNDAPSTATESISLLQALGIDHIDYFPYAPGMKLPQRVDVAITPGELELVPQSVKTVIDIKPRNIDFTTLVEILKVFSLLDEKANLLSATYIKDIIDLIKQTREMANLNSVMATKLQTLINTVHEGIVALDEKNQVSVFNPAAEELLGINRAEILGKGMTSRAFTENIKPVLAGRNGDKERFIRIRDREIVVNVTQIKDMDIPIGQVFFLRNANEIQRLEYEFRRKSRPEQTCARYTFDDIQGDSEPIATATDLARKIARSDSPVLIQGESGTGKELFAQSIHNASPRRNGPFIAVNFAALTESLLESELFGFTEGSFTGAKRGGQAGLFEQAHQGTIFLDEIGDAPLSFQVKLLRVLQERQVRRIGGTQVIPIDVRVITASNKDLKQLIQAGLFRRDLYYRLKVLSFTLPPLKARLSDIPALATRIYERTFKHPRVPAAVYFKQVMASFLTYNWPGNIRELQNVIEYLANICPDDIPTLRQLPEEFQSIAQVNLSAQQEQQLIEAITAAVAAANHASLPVGRRSLAAMLGVSEGTIRRLIAAMVDSGRLIVTRGRNGLRVQP